MLDNHTVDPVHAPESASIRRLGWSLAVLAVPFFGLVALGLGKEAGWDFQNYHWYNPYALMTGRLGFDIAVAHHATYYNPFLDVPLYWLGSHFPGWAAGLWLGAEAGVAAALIGGIAYRALNFADRRARLSSAALLALAGLTGGGALSEIGATPNDIGTGIGALSSLLLVMACFHRIVRAGNRDLLMIALAGLLAGASPGLKLTTLPYAVGLNLAMLALPGTAARRLTRAIAFGLGVVSGTVLFGGYWFWTMWHYAQNPVFPYFNDLFASPMAPPGSYRDATFLPKDGWTRLFFPFVFTQDSLKAGEWTLRDMHILLAYILVPLAGISALFFRPHGRVLVDPIKARYILAAAAAIYTVWLFLFAIYRYLIPLEMLSPIIIVAAVSVLPLKTGLRIVLVTVLLVIAQMVVVRGGDPRLSWSGHYVEVSVPRIEDPANTIILMTETAPMAYVIPSFPPEIPFLRIQGWMIGAKDNSSGLGRAMHDRVAEHRGPIFLLYWPRERVATIEAVADYGFTIDDSRCQVVNTNVSALMDQGFPLQLCPLIRKPS